MKITTRRTDNGSTIKIEGDLVIASVAEAKPEIVAALAGARDIRLDLSAIDDCDTAGVQLLLMARASARLQGKRLATIARSASFAEAVERIGIPAGWFDSHEGTH